MLSEMDKTVDHENGLFGKESQYVDTFKSIVYQQMGRDIANNPRNKLWICRPDLQTNGKIRKLV